jgi:acyl-coenzyme A synthetase/AMP-(fatty) acid ligase
MTRRQVLAAPLAAALQEFVKTHVGFHAYPRLVEFVADLPLTTTGKVQRYLLRRREDAQGTAPARRETVR